MIHENDSEQRDWVIPAVLVGVVVAVAIVIAAVLIVNASDSNDDSLGGQLENWTQCLRSEGVNVPLIEAVRDGGVRITIDGSLLDEGVDFDALRPALNACQSDAPEAVQQFIGFLGYLPLLPSDH